MLDLKKPSIVKISILVIAGLLVFNRCEEEEFSESLQKQFPHLTLVKFSLTETKNGKKLWTLNAAMANVYDEIINVDTVKIKFFDEKQIEYANLNGQSGKLNTKTHNILVRDSVTLFTTDSIKLYTDSLFWQNDSQKILTNSYVKILKQDGTIIEGQGLKTTPDLKRIEVIGAIKGESPIEFPNIR